MTFHFFQVLLLAGLINAGILLWTFPKLPIRDRRPAILLGILLVLIALSFVSFGILPRIRRIIDWFHLIRIPVVFFIGPVFLLLIQSLNAQSPKPIRKTLLHFIPAILEIMVVGGFWIFVELSSPSDRLVILYNPNFSLIHGGLALLHVALYLLAGLQYSKANFNQTRRTLPWSLLYGIAGLLFFWLALYFIEMFQYPRPLCSKYYSPWCLLTLAFYLGIGYHVLINPQWLRGHMAGKQQIGEQLSDIYREIKEVIVQQKLFLDPALKQSDLRRITSVPAYLITKALRAHGETSLTDFLNRLRIETFLQKLEQGQDQNLTLFSIAQESGFKSRATFYRAFKKHTGLTPGAFKSGRS